MLDRKATRRRPDPYEARQPDLSLVPAAVEELLRFNGPATIAGPRYATSDIELAGQHIKRGVGFPEISPRNKIFAATRQQQSSSSVPTNIMEIHPAIAPQPTDIVVTKRRVSAFSESDLDVVLRAYESPVPQVPLLR